MQKSDFTTHFLDRTHERDIPQSLVAETVQKGCKVHSDKERAHFISDHIHVVAAPRDKVSCPQSSTPNPAPKTLNPTSTLPQHKP